MKQSIERFCEAKEFEDLGHAQMLASSMAADRKQKAYSPHPHH